MDSIILNINLLSHPSIIIQTTGMNEIIEKLNNDEEAGLTVLLENTNESNIDNVISIIDAVEPRVNLLELVLSLLPNANNCRTLFRIIFKQDEIINIEIHPFIQILNHRSDERDVWLQEFPIGRLIKSMVLGGDFFLNMLPCLILTGSKFDGLSGKLIAFIADELIIQKLTTVNQKHAACFITAVTNSCNLLGNNCLKKIVIFIKNVLKNEIVGSELQENIDFFLLKITEKYHEIPEAFSLALENNTESFKQDLLLELFSLASKQRCFIRFCKAVLENIKLPDALRSYILSTTLTHVSIKLYLSEDDRQRIDNIFSILTDSDSYGGGVPLVGKSIKSLALKKSICSKWISGLPRSIEWCNDLFNMMFATIISTNIENGQEAIRLMIESNHSKNESFIEVFYVDLYAKIQLATSLNLICDHLRHDIVNLFAILSNPKSRSVCSSSALLTFFSKSQTLSPLAITMRQNQLKENSNLFGFYLRHAYTILSNKNASFLELYIVTHSLQYAVDHTSHYPEVCAMAVNIYERSLYSDLTEKLSEEIAVKSLKILSCLVECMELNLISYWKYLINLWDSKYEKRSRALAEVIYILPIVLDYEPAHKESIQYRNFKNVCDEMINWLWSKTNNDGTKCAAYTALGSFPLKYFDVNQFPQELLAISDEENNEINFSHFFPLIKMENDMSHLAQMFNSMAVKEIGSLPRDIVHRAMKNVQLAGVDKEPQHRLNSIQMKLNDLMSTKRSNPELRLQLSLSKISCEMVYNNENQAIRSLREILHDCPFDPSDVNMIEYLMVSWTKYISCTFGQLLKIKYCLESDENLLVMIMLLFEELSNASRLSPSNQIHAMIGLGALLSEVWRYQKVHGLSENLQTFISNAVEIFVNIISIQPLYTLSWSFYSANESKGQYALSQLARQGVYAIMASYIVDIMIALNQVTKLKYLTDHVGVRIGQLNDLSVLEAYGIGGLAVKLKSSSNLLRAKLEKHIQQQNEMPSYNTIIFLVGAVEQMDSITWHNELSELMCSKNNMLRCKLVIKFPDLDHELVKETSFALGRQSDDVLPSWLDLATNPAALLPSRLNALEALGGVLTSTHSEKSIRSAFFTLLNLVDSPETAISHLSIFKLSQYQLNCRIVDAHVLPTSYSYLGNTSLLRRLVDYIQTDPAEENMVTILKILDIKERMPPIDFQSFLDCFIGFSSELTGLVLKIYSNQSKYSNALFSHLLVHMRENIHKEVYQLFIISNMDYFSNCALQSQTHSRDFEYIKTFLMRKLPSTIISYQYLFQPLIENVLVLKETLLQAAHFIKVEDQFFGLWQEILYGVNDLDLKHGVLEEFLAELTAIKRSVIIFGLNQFKEKFNYKYAVDIILPEIKKLIQFDEQAWRFIADHYSKYMVAVLREHLFLDLVNILQVESSNGRLKVIIGWIFKDGSTKPNLDQLIQDFAPADAGYMKENSQLKILSSSKLKDIAISKFTNDIWFYSLVKWYHHHGMLSVNDIVQDSNFISLCRNYY